MVVVGGDVEEGGGGGVVVGCGSDVLENDGGGVEEGRGDAGDDEVVKVVAGGSVEGDESGMVEICRVDEGDVSSADDEGYRPFIVNVSLVIWTSFRHKFST